MAPEYQNALRAKLGLDLAPISSFFEGSEFVSLGSWCGVALTLEKMGLRKAAYPFDYVRSPQDGVIQCLENDFENFLSFTEFSVQRNGKKFYYGASWGGSFYHHDIESECTQKMFSRRIERFLGVANEKKPSSRVFIRAANTPQDVQDAEKLLVALEQKFQGVPVYLLTLVDMQKNARLFRLQNAHPNMLFYHVRKDLWTQGSRDLLAQRHRCADAYAPGIGAALRFWAQGLRAPMQATVVSGVKVLCALTEYFDAGSTHNELYTPNKLNLPSYVRVPDDWSGGPFTYTSNRWKKNFVLTVPPGCKTGHLLEVRIVNGCVVNVTAADADVTARLSLPTLLGSTVIKEKKTRDTCVEGRGPPGIATLCKLSFSIHPHVYHSL
jgi:hypothetical protein